MTDAQLIKTIQKTVKDEVRPLKEQVEIVKSQVSKLDMYQSGTSHTVRSIKEQQSVINEKLDSLETVKEDVKSIQRNLEQLNEVKEIIEDRIYPSVMAIELDIKAYGDAYKINNDNARKLEKRVVSIEEHAHIKPSSELLLADIS